MDTRVFLFLSASLYLCKKGQRDKRCEMHPFFFFFSRPLSFNGDTLHKYYRDVDVGTCSFFNVQKSSKFLIFRIRTFIKPALAAELV